VDDRGSGGYKFAAGYLKNLKSATPELETAPMNEPNSAPAPAAPVEGLDEHLIAQLPTFELFFKTVGFKRVHGRIWGLLVLAGRPLTAREIGQVLALSQGATSMALHELTEWGAITSEFDSSRRCHAHAPVSNTLSIAATVIRRREQVVFQQLRSSSTRMLAYVQEQYGDKDPRVLTLRSIISTCEIAEAVMQLVVGAVAHALDDSQSLLHKAVATALKVGVVVPSRVLLGKDGLQHLASSALGPDRDETDAVEAPALRSVRRRASQSGGVRRRA
jgi:DNA-binding transcriptional regulator GbsR (MarR family)